MTPEQFDLHARIEDNHWWFVARRGIVRRIVREILAPSPDATIVDIGCGTGGNLAALSREYGCVGIDRSPNAIQHAGNRFPDITFICGNAFGESEGLKDVKDRADLYLLLDVLEHIAADGQFLRDVATIMKPGSHLLLTVPADMSLWSAHDENHGHYRRYDRSTVLSLCSELPSVSVRLVSYFNMFLYPAIKVIRTLGRYRKRVWGEAGTDLSVPPKVLNHLLAQVFLSEAKFLVRALRSGYGRSMPFGVSLIALLRKR